MKKKTLGLKKVTLRDLDYASMQHVAGADTDTYLNTCPITNCTGDGHSGINTFNGNTGCDVLCTGTNCNIGSCNACGC